MPEAWPSRSSLRPRTIGGRRWSASLAPAGPWRLGLSSFGGSGRGGGSLHSRSRGNAPARWPTCTGTRATGSLLEAPARELLRLPEPSISKVPGHRPTRVARAREEGRAAVARGCSRARRSVPLAVRRVSQQHPSRHGGRRMVGEIIGGRPATALVVEPPIRTARHDGPSAACGRRVRGKRPWMP